MTSNLADIAVHGVAASVSGRAIYIATDTGVFFMRTDVSVLSFPGQWQPVTGLPAAPVDGCASRRGRQPAVGRGTGIRRVLHAGAASVWTIPKWSAPRILSRQQPRLARLMSILGAKVSSAQAGNLAVPVLPTTETESQIQIPFEATGTTLSLSFDPASGSRVTTPLAMAPASPGILVDGDGTPVLLDAATGARLDASNPAHSRARIQIVATGLGRVNPDWPAGKPAPYGRSSQGCCDSRRVSERRSGPGRKRRARAWACGILSGRNRASAVWSITDPRSCPSKRAATPATQCGYILDLDASPPLGYSRRARCVLLRGFCAGSTNQRPAR